MSDSENEPRRTVVETIHLQPCAELAERVLLPGHPGRALALAQDLIEAPKMFNHHRGLWGYTGAARADGAPLSIQSTGMGGPSAAIVISELIDLGARQLVRVGTAGGLAEGLALGDLLVASEALCEDGTSRALGAARRASGDPALTSALVRTASAAGPRLLVSTDVFYDRRGLEAKWRDAGAAAVEMECATLFTLGRARGVATGALVIVSDLLFPSRQRIKLEAMEQAELQMGRAAAAALEAG